MKISIIIPVYNTEKYVERCLRSCIDQDLSKNEYEIIVVNDGTKDNSLAIVEKIAAECSNVLIISQENAGLSAARNAGLSIAKGKYVWFVDSDDWIESNCLGNIVDKMEGDNLEGLVHAGIRYVDEGNVYYLKSDYPKAILSGRDYMANYTINCAAVKTVYLRSFLEENNLRFYKGIYHEDHEFTPRAYYFIKRIGFTDLHFYYNRLTVDSITQKPNPKKAFDLMIVANNLYDFKLKHDMQGVDRAFNNLIVSAINQALSNTTYMEKSTRSKLNNVISEHRFLLKAYSKSSVLKNRFVGILFRMFPSHVVESYLVLKKFK